MDKKNGQFGYQPGGIEKINQQSRGTDINQQHRDHRSRRHRHQVDQQCKIKTNSKY